MNKTLLEEVMEALREAIEEGEHKYALGLLDSMNIIIKHEERNKKAIPSIPVEDLPKDDIRYVHPIWVDPTTWELPWVVTCNTSNSNDFLHVKDAFKEANNFNKDKKDE